MLLSVLQVFQWPFYFDKMPIENVEVSGMVEQLRVGFTE